MHINGSANWRQTFPSRLAPGEGWGRWLLTALYSLALSVLLAAAATRPFNGAQVTVTLLLIVVTSGILGALLRACWLPARPRLVTDDWSLHPAVAFALRRVARALDEGVEQHNLLELIARSALDISRGAGCILALPNGRALQVDRTGAAWVERSNEASAPTEPGSGSEPGALLRTPLSALGETLGTLELWPRPGQRFDLEQEAMVTFFAAEAAVAARDTVLLNNARARADTLESKVVELERWQGQLDVYATDLARTYGELNAAKSTLDETYMATLEALASAVDARDPYTYGHCKRVAELAALLGAEIGLPPEERHVLEQVALLHDIGKIGVPDATLRKTTPLTPEDWVSIQQHPELGFKMLCGLRFLGESLSAIRHHHERYDGTGYPSKLAGDEIPVMARVLSVADAYDAITSDRPYRPGRSKEQGLAEIQRCTGSYFDPAVVDALLKILGDPVPVAA